MAENPDTYWRSLGLIVIAAGAISARQIIMASPLFPAAQPIVALDAAAPQGTGRLDSQSFGFTILLDSRRRASGLNRWAVCSSIPERNHQRRSSFKVTRIGSSRYSWFVSGNTSCQRHMVTPQRTPRARFSTKLLHSFRRGIVASLPRGSPASDSRPRVGDDCLFNTAGL